MARKLFSVGQELISQDFNDLQKLKEKELYEIALYELVQRSQNVFFGDSFLVEYVDADTVRVRKGLGLQYLSGAVHPDSKVQPMYLTADQLIDTTMPNGSLNRIDIVCVKSSRVNTLTATRNIKSSIDSTISSSLITTESEWAADLVITAGTPHASPSVPATPSGYIKIAELLITAVSGMSGAGAVTDKRSLVPAGESVLINSAGFVSLTGTIATPLKTLLTEIDALLKHGKSEYIDMSELSVDPSNPAANYRRLYSKNGVTYMKDSTGSVIPIGSGAGGGGGANWNAEGGTAPIESVENGEKVWLFESGLGQKLTLFVKVPQGYLSGRQIMLYIGHYSPSAAGTQLLSSVSYLIRKNNDAISSTTNSAASGNAALTNTLANQYREVALPLTNSSGQINSLTVQPGDLIRVELSRATDTDAEDIRFVPSATEVKFG